MTFMEKLHVPADHRRWTLCSAVAAFTSLLVVVFCLSNFQKSPSVEFQGTIPSSFYTDEERLKMRFQSRRELIQRVCQQYELPPNKDVRRKYLLRTNQTDEPNEYQKQWLSYNRPKEKKGMLLMVDLDHSLCYCWTRKVASTSWQMLFYGLANETISPKKAHKGIGRFGVNKVNRKPDDIIDDDGILKFFFARHPFDRLVSAFVQKFELDYKDDFIFKKFTPLIFKANNLPYSVKKKPRPTFKQFVTYLLQLPTISCFDDHWRPQWLHCRICEWDFHIPGHLETVEEDSNYIVTRANITNAAFPWNNNSKHPRHGLNRSHTVDDDQSSTAAYLAELEPNQVQALIDLYRLDFELFGYSPNEFFD